MCYKVFTEQTGLENLYKMLSYCQELHSCRRSLIGQHFGEEWRNEECKGMCDNCQRSENGECLNILLHMQRNLVPYYVRHFSR